ncbi:ADP-ribosylation factor 6 [Golovinomyces cichoracearum]|uniref:ADP-ribosylation factor n=1 Tax=Golovinomyces cichoracearum TaxID=62708 RepID=A0A420IME5_9PEZI|nr:ADP-ribosylation factor 6 [Golovinomyces cichoracearum]
MSKLLLIKMLNLMYGMLVARTKSDRYGDTTLVTGTQGLIFVIDSSDRARIEEARQELHRIINDREMRECLLLVFANKQDIAGAMNPQEVTDSLKLASLTDKIWFVVPSCATTGEGLLEGLAWLSNNVKSPPNVQKR